MQEINEMIENSEALQAKQAFETAIADQERMIQAAYAELKSTERAMLESEAQIPSARNREEKKRLSDSVKEFRIKIKLIKGEIDTFSAKKHRIETELAKLIFESTKEFIGDTNEDSANKVFTDHNIHYVIFDQQWWSVDPAGNRMDIKINSSDVGVIKDLIFNDCNWEITNEQELKRLAKKLGRMYKHIVRDFDPRPRSGIYNQMTDIRANWLQPVAGVTPHPAFRILLLSIAGGNEDYADQLERFVAYRYCHPEDVMVPNIDSCATGGTGRDTFFNILRTIFTDECCGSVGEETFRGTHNGDLFGKMIIKVDEKNSQSVPIDKVKELTGSTKYRHRAMNRDARDVSRLFSLLMFRNGFTTTAKLAGTGSSGEDRRFEPIIARLNLTRYVALHHEIVQDLNQELTDAELKAMQIIIKEWQRDYYKDEARISEWLGYIIERHQAEAMTELLPLHGVYYKEMLMRQERGIDGFMPKFLDRMAGGSTTVISIKDAHRLYETAESVKCTKEWFRNAVKYWLNTKRNWDCEEITGPVYPWEGAVAEDRRIKLYVQNRLSVPQRHIFDLTDFVDPDAVDEKGTTVGQKINVFSLRDELK